jgi:hypothetical protein
VVGFFLADLASFQVASAVGWPVVLAGLVAAYILAVVIHELGHALAGWSVGYRLFQLAIGPLVFHRTPRGLVAQLRRTPAIFGGLCVSVPLDDHDLRRRDAIMVAGGSLANLLTALVVAVSLMFLPALPALADTLLRMFGLLSAVIGLSELIPLQSNGLSSDGEQLRRLARSGASAGRTTAIRLVYGSLMADVRPRELPEAIIRRAIGTPDGSTEHVMGTFMAFIWAMDQGRLGEAGSYLDQTLAGLAQLPPLLQGGIYIEAAYFTALHRNDAQTARALFERGRNGLVEQHDRLRAEAAVLYAEGRLSEARQVATTGLQTLANARHVHSRGLDEAWLRELLTRLEQAQR